MKTVILGGRGFLGSALAKRLPDVLALGAADVDLSLPAAVEKLRSFLDEGDQLVFAAALTPDRGKDVRTAMKNLAMGEHVAAVANRCAYIVYVSSDAVYADDANPVRETSCASPTTLYGLMHLMRERMMLASAGKTPVMIVRPCALYGAGDTHNSYGPNRFMRTAAKDRRIQLFGQGEEQRDHLYVEDCARLIELCLRERRHGVLNAATGRATSFMEVAQLAADIVGAVQISGQPRTGPITHRHFDITETIRAFPCFQFTPLTDGLRSMR